MRTLIILAIGAILAMGIASGAIVLDCNARDGRATVGVDL